MSKKEIIVTIQPDGASVVDAVGFKGVGCAEATKSIEMVLAGDMGNVSDTKKPEFYSAPGLRNTVTGR